MPGLIEADDDGLYVVKFRGAGQGEKALVAELICAGIAQSIGLAVPDVVLVDLDPELARAEPDPEVQELIRASAGVNFGIDFLPGSLTFDPAADGPVDPSLAASVVWFDALVLNVDRTPRNPNLLVWHGRLRPIDHGAALYFHHGSWEPAAAAVRAFPVIRDHVLLEAAGPIDSVDAELAAKLGRAELETIVGAVPDGWLGDDPTAARSRYVEFLAERLAEPRGFVAEAEAARREVAA